MNKQISDHAAAAKQIRQHLKSNGINGRVRARSYAGGSSVDVYLHEELPATFEAVIAFANQYQYGHFDGMTDCYHYSNGRDDLPQVQFVFVNNDFSDETLADAWAYCQKNHANAGKTSDPYLHEDRVLLSGLMKGHWGTWLANRKPRIRLSS